MDQYRAIRLRALGAVVKPNKDYIIRKVLRWYSKTFFTPLAQVEDLPLEDVFQAFYEEKYAEMSEEEVEAERQELLTSDQDRYEQILAEEAEEAEMFETGKLMAAQMRAKKALVATPQKGNIADIRHQVPGPIRSMEAPESELPSVPRELPPGISMTFVSESDFEQELETLGAMSQPERTP
jgi:hypothetical protein